MERRKTEIDWTLPPFSRGIRGLLERVAGPGVTNGELALQILLPLLAAALAYFHTANGPSYSTARLILAAVLGFDIAGGVITNSTSSAKRWYHRAGQGFWHHSGFIALHLIHLALVWYFFDLELWWLPLQSVFLLIAASIVLLVPLHVQRPISLTLYAIALVATVNQSSVPGLEWFLPLFYLKLLVAHLPVEEPYRPVSRKQTEPGAGPEMPG
ncbi:MAG: hypothetical protein KDK23_15920 [Leptospiraceae bacterium]|nr:hypothetical protein [Leptospiraceae bacterium]